MNFSPKNTAELEEERKARMQLMDPGPADFVVKSAIDTLSQSDNTEMIELQVEVTDAHGNTKVLKDWLTPKMMGKMRNFCYGTGAAALYDQGSLMAEHCAGLGGRCLLAVEKGGMAADGGRYPDKNKIRDYIAGNGSPAPAPKSPAVSVPDSTAAMRKAQSAYKAKMPAETPRDELVEAWNQNVKKYFFGKDPDLITAAEWNKFAADGFKKPAAQQPFADDAVEFDDSSIPF